MLADWFRKRAPEYEVIWWAGPGGDVLIEGRGILAAVDITSVPKAEDVWQLKHGVGAVKAEWGREPDLLIVYSHSGIVPDETADLAGRLGVKVVRGARELKEILNEYAAEAGRDNI